MRITFVTPDLNLSGGTRVIAMYADQMKRRGHQVTVVSKPLPQPTIKQQVKSVLKGKGLLTVPNRPPSHFDQLDIDCRVKERSLPVIDADVPDADVVVATWWETAEWVAKLSPSKGAKAYLIQHYETFDYLPVERVQATWSLPLHKIVVAQWLADLAREVYGDRHVSLVPNGVDTQQFFAAPRTKQTVPTFGLMYSPLYWKGCDISLKAFAIAAKEVPNLRLITFGYHPLSPELPLPKGSVYLQNPEQRMMRYLYSACDAWLFGSRLEGFGLPILEALACRTPVIGTSAGAAPELLATGAGILVKQEDPHDMARAIIEICRSPRMTWMAMSDMAHHVAVQHSWEKPAAQFEQALYQAIERSQRSTYPVPRQLSPQLAS